MVDIFLPVWGIALVVFIWDHANFISIYWFKGAIYQLSVLKCRCTGIHASSSKNSMMKLLMLWKCFVFMFYGRVSYSIRNFYYIKSLKLSTEYIFSHSTNYISCECIRWICLCWLEQSTFYYVNRDELPQCIVMVFPPVPTPWLWYYLVNNMREKM